MAWQNVEALDRFVFWLQCTIAIVSSWNSLVTHPPLIGTDLVLIALVETLAEVWAPFLPSHQSLVNSHSLPLPPIRKHDTASSKMTVLTTA